MLDFFFFKQKTAYEMRISDWSSDVCSSDLHRLWLRERSGRQPERRVRAGQYSRRQWRLRLWQGQCRQRRQRQRVRFEIGRASCRERVCQDVEFTVVAGSFKKKKTLGTPMDNVSISGREPRWNDRRST